MNPKPIVNLSRYVEKMTGLGYSGPEVIEFADMAAMLAAAGVTVEQAQVFAKVAATGRFTVDSFLLLRERGIDMPKETAEHLLHGNPPRNAPPADDVREALATQWLASHHGSIDATALILAFKAGYAAAEVRPHGTVTDAEVQAALGVFTNFFFTPSAATMRAALEAAREVHP